MSRRRMKKHADSVHFKNRMKYRIGMDISLLDEIEIKDLICGNKYKQYAFSLTRSLHKVPFKGKELWIIYNKNTHNPLTVLTEEMALTNIEKDKALKEVLYPTRLICFRHINL